MLGYFFGRLLFEAFRVIAYVVYFVIAFLIAAVIYTVVFVVWGSIVGSMKLIQWWLDRRREKFDRDNERIGDDLPSWRFQ